MVCRAYRKDGQAGQSNRAVDRRTGMDATSRRQCDENDTRQDGRRGILAAGAPAPVTPAPVFRREPRRPLASK